MNGGVTAQTAMAIARSRWRPPASIGMRIDEVDTPALIVDLDAFDHNLATMMSAVAASGIRVRRARRDFLAIASR